MEGTGYKLSSDIEQSRILCRYCLYSRRVAENNKVVMCTIHKEMKAFDDNCEHSSDYYYR